jgi:hypothetical protein
VVIVCGGQTYVSDLWDRRWRKYGWYACSNGDICRRVYLGLQQACQQEMKQYILLSYAWWVFCAGIANRYELDGLGIKSRYGLDFPHPSRLLYDGHWVIPWVMSPRLRKEYSYTCIPSLCLNGLFENELYVVYLSCLYAHINWIMSSVFESCYSTVSVTQEWL